MGKTRQGLQKETQDQKHPHAPGEDLVKLVKVAQEWETSSRPWGRQAEDFFNLVVVRNIPTPVGKTLWLTVGQKKARKHPHARGEDLTRSHFSFCNCETSSRPWGRHAFRLAHRARGGNIPTPVGKTFRTLQTQVRIRKHPHARGEDLRSTF